MIKNDTTISNKLGLHARASAKLTKLAGSFPCDVWIARGERRVNAKSIMGVMMLAAGIGSQVTVETDGDREQEAMDAILALIDELDGSGKLAFTKTKDEEEGKRATAFKVTLGVMPDYVYTGEGMRIDGVIDGRPGAKAGLENGDVIIRIGDTEVKDIYGYMEGLGKYKTGDKAIVVVKRGEEVIEKEVEF